MSEVKLLPHQVDAIRETEKFNKVAYYFDMRWDLAKHL